MEHKYKNIFADELYNHFKYTIGAVIIAMAIIFLMKKLIMPASLQDTSRSEHMFEGFFVAHLFFASLTPAALFKLYKRSFVISVLIAIISSSLTCTLSDIIFPYAGGLLLNYQMDFHVCIIEEPVLAWSFVISGALIGFLLSGGVKKLSRFTHGAHILLSSLAAGMYLVTYGVSFFSLKAFAFLPILIISVLIPCVMNDIGVPSFIVSASAAPGEDKKKLLDEIHHAHHDHHH